MWHNVCGWLQEKGVIVDEYNCSADLTNHSNEFWGWGHRILLKMSHFCCLSVPTFLKGGFLAKRRWAWQGSSHLVSRHGELLELCVNLWVASRGGGKLGLCSGLPAAKKTQTCDSNYDLHKDLSLCKSQRERERERGSSQAEMSPFPLQLVSDDDIICTGRAVSRGWRGVVHWLLLLALVARCSPTNPTFNSTLWTKKKSL